MKDFEILNKIKTEGDRIEVPDNLKPENISHLLEGKKVKKQTKTYRYLIPTVAAAVLLLVLVPVGLRNLGTKETKTSVVASYEELYDLFVYEEERTSFLGRVLDNVDYELGTNQTMEEDASSSGTQKAYSSTNTQVQGVDEGDIVKTDGDYIFIARQDVKGKVEICSAQNGKVEKVSAFMTDWKDVAVIKDMYLDDGRLTLIGTNADQGVIDNDQTYILTYDIADKASPKLIDSHKQSGEFQTSRKIGNYLYTASTYYVDNLTKRTSKKDYKEYVPCIEDKLIDAGDIYIPSKEHKDSYTVITALDVSAKNGFSDKMAIASLDDIFYMSEGYMYISEELNETFGSKLMKFSYQDGKFKKLSEVKLEAKVKDRFCLDEYKGYLRVVASTQNANALYILDEELNMTGSITGVAAMEQLHSARFMGDTGYFVTFRQTDPLFSVDLSNPREPKIIGALKIPGFSEYMQFYDDKYLVGIGEEDGEIKISMFDVSDPSDVKEVDKKILYGYSYSEALTDSHAVLINKEKNLIAFPAEENYGYEQCDYFVYSFSKKQGFKEKMKVSFENPMYQERENEFRGMYIENFLYVINSYEGVYSYGLPEFNEKGSYKFN